MKRIMLAVAVIAASTSAAQAVGCDFGAPVHDAATQMLAAIRKQMDETYRPTEPSKSTREYLADFLYGIEIKLYGPQIRANQQYPRYEMQRLWDFHKNSNIPTIAECFPGYDDMVYEARRRNVTRLTARLFDVYRSWIYVNVCNQARSGYVMVFVNDIELARARRAVKAIEAQLNANDPDLNIDQVWNNASRFSQMEVDQAQCRRTLLNLLKSKPGGAFEVQPP